MGLKELVKFAAKRRGYELRDAAYLPHSCERKIYDYYLEARDGVRTIFDVGANIGQTARGFRAAFPNAVIYCFEPFARAFQELRENTKSLGSVHCVPIALGLAPMTLEVASEPERLDINSLLPERQENLRSRGVTGTEVITVRDGAGFCAENGIDRIDILKIDTEGFELPVLAGFGEMLGPAVKAILCEFCLLENDDRQTPLLKLHERLQPQGYDLASVYDIRYEADGSFHYGNALFVHRDHLKRNRRW